MKTTFKVTDKGRRSLRSAQAQLNAWVKEQSPDCELTFSLTATVNDDVDEAVKRTGNLFDGKPAEASVEE